MMCPSEIRKSRGKLIVPRGQYTADDPMQRMVVLCPLNKKHLVHFLWEPCNVLLACGPSNVDFYSPAVVSPHPRRQAELEMVLS